MGMAPLGHQGARARAALRPALAPQARLIRTARRQTGLERGHIRINFPGAAIAPLIGGQGPRPQPMPDRMPGHATGRRDLPHALATSGTTLPLLIAGCTRGLSGGVHLLELGGAPIAGQGPERGGRQGRGGRRRHGRMGQYAADPLSACPPCGGRRDPNRRIRQDTAQYGRDPLQIAGQHVVEVTTVNASDRRPGRLLAPLQWHPGHSPGPGRGQ
jgi:hypothetical protein